MRILYDHQVFSRQTAGGASRYFYELMRYFSGASEVEVELLIGSSGTVFPVKQLRSPNTHVVSFQAPALPGVWRYIANEVVGNSIAPFLGRMDVYHPTLYRCMPTVRARRVVATHHDCTQERFPEEFRYVSKVMRAKAALYAKADAIICVSQSCRDDLLKFYSVDATKTRVIYHGLRQLPSCPAAAGMLRGKMRREFMLYVGSRASYKNFGGLLKAYRETRMHEELDLLVLGGGPLTKEETALAASLGIADGVINIPVTSDEVLGEAYAAARLFVYPSLWEGFGLPPLEAMAAGCPVVVGRTSALLEICREAAFYFDPASPVSFNVALLQATGNEEARRRAIEKGREVALQYSWKTCGRQTLALYRECQ